LNRKIVSGILLALLLIGTLILIFNFPQVKADNNLLLEMSVSKTIVTIGEKISIKLTLKNVGLGPVAFTYTPPLFDVYYCTSEGCFRWSDGMYFIQVILQSTLGPGENHTQTLQWNLNQFREGVFNPPKPGTYYLFGLCYPAGIATQYFVMVTLIQWDPCDVNYDLKVDVKDIAIGAKAFGSFPSHPLWNPHADINQDNKVDIKDIALIAKNFGKTYP